MAVKISEIRGQGPAARAYMWDVQLPRAGGDSFKVRCSTAAQPNPSYEKIEYGIKAFTIPEVGGVTWNDLTFTAVETNTHSIIQSLYDWGTRAFHPSDGNHPEEKAASGIDEDDNKIILHKMDGDPSKTWTLHNAVITGELAFPEMVSDKTAIMEVSFTLAYAWATMESSS